MRAGDPNLNGEHGAADTPQTDQALRWLRAAGAEQEIIGEAARRVRNKRRRRLTALGAACVTLGVVSWTSRTVVPDRIATADTTRVATATVSAPQRQVLPDGTVVELKNGAAIAPDYTDALRRVTLLRGEAHFQVAKNPARPFVVAAGAVAVRAVGTAFSVQFAPSAVEVLVTEGRVAVERDTANPPPANATVESPAVLQAGGRAVIRLDGPDQQPEVSALNQQALAQRLAWRVPQLEFSQTPLPEVIALMNVHGRGARQIVLELPPADAAQMKLSGFLSADNTEGLVRLLEANFPVSAVATSNSIRLRKTGR